jgi:hypothetical protein
MRLSAELFQQIVDALKSDGHSDRDKRLEPRVGMAGEANLVSLRDDGRCVTNRARIRDVSRTGIGLVHNRRFESNKRFIIQLQSHTGDPIWLICMTAYCRRQSSDCFSIGSRISQVLHADEINDIEHKREGIASKLDAQRAAAAAISAADRNTMQRISRAILS